MSTPAAQAAIFDLVSEGNRALERGEHETAAAVRAALLELTGVLGYSIAEQGGGNSLVGPLVEELLQLRREARERKDFATADSIRARLTQIGIVVEDSADGTRWHISAAG
jgi:cysteinyl-tRNA synthetase